MYAIFIRPYESMQANAIYVYNELVLVVTFCVLLAVNFVEINDTVQASLGWMAITFILLSFILTWVILSPPMVHALFQQACALCSGTTLSATANVHSSNVPLAGEPVHTASIFTNPNPSLDAKDNTNANGNAKESTNKNRSRRKITRREKNKAVIVAKPLEPDDITFMKQTQHV